jgi:UDP-N-acetylmuramoyl-tripeptide--D-alanyl-D-alanine ligase
VITLADILEALTGQRPTNAPLAISEAEVDSRQVIPGGMFVALHGEKADGHEFVDEAFHRGASLALVQRDLSAQYPQIDLRRNNLPDHFIQPEGPVCLLVIDTLQALQTISKNWRTKLDMDVIGITGSVGKSTTKDLVTEVLSKKFRTIKSSGNRNNEIGLPLSLLKVGQGHQRAVLEMGFYVPGEISFLCEIALPKIGVVTNISAVHAERAGSLEAIARGKAELVRALPPAPQGIAILNYDDLLVRQMADQTNARVFFYGLNSEADLWADEIAGLGLEGIRLRLHYQKDTLTLHAPLIGHHSVHTILRAAAVGLVEKLNWDEIIMGLKQGRSQLRMVAVRADNGALIIDDSYNASPDSTLAALNLLDEMDGRKVAVLGDMLELGPYEQKGHEMVGLRAGAVCDELIAIGERSKTTARLAAQAGLAATSIKWVQTAPDAIPYLKNNLCKGDTVLIKGSLGMKMSRIVTALEVDE